MLHGARTPTVRHDSVAVHEAIAERYDTFDRRVARAGGALRRHYLLGRVLGRGVLLRMRSMSARDHAALPGGGRRSSPWGPCEGGDGVQVVDRLFLVVYAANPTDEEWAEYLDLVQRHGIERTLHSLSPTAVSPRRRSAASLNELLGGRTVPVAVVSGSVRVRRTITALSWFIRRIKAFPPSGLRDALAYLDIPRAAWS